MKAYNNSDALFVAVHQLSDELSDLGELVSTERVTTIVFNALPVKKYATMKYQATKDLGITLV